MIPVTTKDYRTLKVVLNGPGLKPLRQLLLNTPLQNGGKVIRLKPQQAVTATALKLFGFKEAAGKMALPVSRKHFTPADNALVEDAVASLTQLAGICSDIVTKGETVNNNVSEYPAALANSTDSNVISLSRILHGKEVMLVYNADAGEPKERFVTTGKAHTLKPLFGYESTGHMHARLLKGSNLHYIKVYLKPLQLIVLQSID